MATRALMAGWWNGSVYNILNAFSDSEGVPLHVDNATATSFATTVSSVVFANILRSGCSFSWHFVPDVFNQFDLTFPDIDLSAETIPPITNTALILSTGVVSGYYRWPVHNVLTSTSVAGYDVTYWNAYAGSLTAGQIFDGGASFVSNTHRYLSGGYWYNTWLKNLRITCNLTLSSLRLHFVESSGAIDAYWEATVTLAFRASFTKVLVRETDSYTTETSYTNQVLGDNTLTIKRICSGGLSLLGDYALSGTVDAAVMNPIALVPESAVTLS